MAKDDISLGEEMGKLEIEPIKFHKNVKDENPFQCSTFLQKRNIVFERTQTISKCECVAPRKTKPVSVCKKKHKRILTKPFLRMLQDEMRMKTKADDDCSELSGKCSLSLGNSNNSEVINLCDLVNNCNQLRISSGSKEDNLVTGANNGSQWWKSTAKLTKETKATVPTKSQAGSCSQEALNPPCDVTIDELASYFETLVHIPKKMSSMAEMMYI